MKAHEITHEITKVVTLRVVDGKKLRHARKARGLTLRALGQLVGVSDAFLCDLEHDRRSAKPETLDHIVAALAGKDKT